MIRRLLDTVDKWAPLTVSVLALFLVVIMGWWYSERIARLEGKVSVLEHQQLQVEVSAIKNWMIAVYERGEAKGWDLPDLPITKIDNKQPVNNKVDDSNNSKKENKK